MKEDEEIIRLRENIRRSAQAKVANGTMSVSDMLKEITAENLARQAKAVHEVQLLMHLHQRKHLTNDERDNQVYAVKIAVENDGHIKLGMDGKVKF